MFKYRYYILWWTATLLAFLCFDIFFCLSTSFKPFEFKVIYPTLIACATLFSLPAAISVKSRWQIIVLSIISVLFEANLMYCRTYSSHIPLECYTMASNLKEFGGSVIDSMRWYDISFPAIIIVSSILSMRMKVRRRPSVKVYLAILLVFFSDIVWPDLIERRIQTTNGLSIQRGRTAAHSGSGIFRFRMYCL